MNDYKEPSDLLLESDIISEEEKQKIIADIDRGFFSSSQKSSSLDQISAKSNGLFIPFLILSLSITITILILLGFYNYIQNKNDTTPLILASDTSGAEWEMLSTFMLESTKKLEKKDLEIDIYKGEIVSYDIKLSTLRKLLTVKKDTEVRLASERLKLRTEGIAEAEIDSKINLMEENLISELAPDMISFYNLSIDDLNNQIEQVLDDKTKSEELLEVSIVEREVLVVRNEEISDEVKKIKEDDLSQLPEVIEIMKRMNEITEQFDYEQKIRNDISGLYLKIFQNLELDDYETALESVDDLQFLLINGMDNSEYKVIDQLSMQIKIADLLKEYIYKSITISQLPLLIETDSPDVVEVENKAEKLLLFGTISLVQFDHIYIESISGFEISAGTDFYVFKSDNKDRAIGSGIITGVSDGLIAGLLNSEISSSSLPDTDDLIYIKPDIN